MLDIVASIGAVIGACGLLVAALASVRSRNARFAAKKVFISYSHADAELALRVAGVIEEAGYAPWIDQESIRPGMSIKDAIERGIRESGAAIYIVPADAKKMPNWQEFELATMLLQRESRSLSKKVGPIIPLYADTPRGENAPKWLQDTAGISANDPEWPKKIDDYLEKAFAG